jgi:hypothetical protein
MIFVDSAGNEAIPSRQAEGYNEKGGIKDK